MYTRYHGYKIRAAGKGWMIYGLSGMGPEYHATLRDCIVAINTVVLYEMLRKPVHV